MDGGADKSGYVARIAAAFKELEASGARIDKRALADALSLRVKDLETVLDGSAADADAGAQQGAPLPDREVDHTNGERPLPERRRTRLPNISFGMRPSSTEPQLFDDDADVYDDTDDDEEEYTQDMDRYASADAVYEYDDQVIQSSDGEPNLEFDADRPALLLLVFRNTLLTILTFGLYRFWAQRAVRQFLWRTVSFQEEHPDYQGRAIDSLLAFCAVLLTVLVLATLFVLLPQLFVPFRPINWALELFFLASLFLTYQVWCQWRRRYNLVHTAWHGIRFERSRQSPRRLLPLLGVWSLVLLTAGLAYPLARVICARDLFKDVSFGPASVVVDANAQPLLLPWGIVYGTLLITTLVVAEPFFDVQSSSALGMLLILLAKMALIIASFGAMVWYKCGEFDYFVSSLYVGQSQAYSDISAWRIMMKAALPVFGFLIFALSLFVFAFFAFDAFLQLTAEESPTNVSINTLAIGLGIGATLIGGFIYQALLNLFRLDVLSAIAENGSIE